MSRGAPFETPWVYIPAIVVIWVGLWSAVEILLFDGDVFSAAVQGIAGGLVFGIVFYYIGQRE